MTVLTMGLTLSIVSWSVNASDPAKVLLLRERAFVMMSKLSGMSGMEIILRELMPNLMPYLAISLAGAVNGGVLGSLGLQTLGIGNLREPSLGMTIYWLRYYNAFLQGYWWWIIEPVIVIALIFISFLLLSIGLMSLRIPGFLEDRMSEPILQVKHLKVYYYVEAGAVKAVDDVTFDLADGTKMGLVGESGSGKSTMAQALMRMIKPPGKIEGGQMILDGGSRHAQRGADAPDEAAQVGDDPAGRDECPEPGDAHRPTVDRWDAFDHGVVLSKQEREERVNQLLEMVDLAPRWRRCTRTS